LCGYATACHIDRGRAAWYDANVGEADTAHGEAGAGHAGIANPPQRRPEMAKKHAHATVETVEAATPAIEAPAPVVTIEDSVAEAAALLAEAADDAEIDEQIALGNSKVQRKYKLRYRDRARAMGLRQKWQKRTNNDWMATTLAGEVLDKQSKIHVPSFAAILIANGVEEPTVLSEAGEFQPSESRWPSQSKGWEGRYRMSGGLALRTVVAEAGVMLLADGETLEAPAEWVAKILR